MVLQQKFRFKFILKKHTNKKFRNTLITVYIFINIYKDIELGYFDFGQGFLPIICPKRVHKSWVGFLIQNSSIAT